MLLGIKAITWFFALLVAAGAVTFAFAVLALLILLDSSSECGGESRMIVVTEDLSATFQSKRDGFDATLDGGTATTVRFDESEVTSRATSYLEEKDAPIKGLKVCIYPGEGEAGGKIKTPFPGLDVSACIEGAVDLSGAQPKAEITDIEIAWVPGPLSGPIKGFVRGLVDDQLEDIELEHRYSLDLADGIATVNGQP
jgi:hypothetical protein